MAQLHGNITTSVPNADHKDPLSPESLRVFVLLAVEVSAFEVGLDAWAESRRHLLPPDTFAPASCLAPDPLLPTSHCGQMLQSL